VTADVVGLLVGTPVGDVLLRADWWLLNSPAGAVLSTRWGVYVAVPVVVVAVIAAGAGLGAKWDRIAAAARTGAVNAALTLSCLTPPRAASARTASHRTPAARGDA